MNTTAQQLAQQIANQNADAAKQGSADQAQEASATPQTNVPPAPTPAPQETDKSETPAQSNPNQITSITLPPNQEIKDFKPQPVKIIPTSTRPPSLGDTVIFYPAPDTQPFRKQKTVAAIVTEVTTPTTVSLTAFGKGFTEPVPYNNVPLKKEEGQTYCFSQK